MIIYLFFYMLQGKDFDDLHDFIKKKQLVYGYLS